MGEEKFACPKCGMLVSKGDSFCKNCGLSLVEAPVSETTAPVVTEEKVEMRYERRFSLVQRFYGLMFAPSGAMEDVALAPDYGGVAVIVALELIVSILSIVLAFQKIHFVGAYATAIMNVVNLALMFAVFLGFVLLIARWLIKALIVKYACDSGSGWDFKTAASVTGYAYLATIIVSVLSLCVSWFLLPEFVVDTTNLQAAIQTMNEYRAQMNWLILVYSLPVSLIGLAWKSYLGGLGAHFGTKRRCSVGTGVMVFFLLGLIPLFFSFIGVF
ncbi:MAG: zinc ribbon domain-containing protein [Candidatus Bathyarchaeota archaeon]|nr:zinc ribbon domain-containing protein [Candidatus Bathyarchaeota archaeon]MDH5787712.1 zinc ribbon domain-containing protein [Candidatus Bathyarchaeota archaeon]